MTGSCGAAGGAGRGRLVGILLLLDFVFVVLGKLVLGRPQDLAWISHVGLLVAGLGFLLSCDVLLATAFVSLASLHLIWLIDAGGGLLGGSFPLGATRYLGGASLLEWLSTMHHFYLLPLLAGAMYRRARCPGAAYAGGVALYLYLSVLSRAFLPPADNINFVYGVEVDVARPFLDWANRQPAWLYLFGLNAFVALVLMLPPFVLARAWSRRREPNEARAAVLGRAGNPTQPASLLPHSSLE